MRQGVLGNLEEWGRVLEQLGELTRSGDIERHQDELLALLQCSDNWRLREAALETVPAVQHPGEPLVREVCSIMLNEGLYFQARVLAAEVLDVALDRLAERSETEVMKLRRDIRDHMHALLSSQAVPVLHQAARRILPKVE